MISHFIIMSNSYKEHTRIALDITEEHGIDVKHVSNVVKKIKKICGDDTPMSAFYLCRV